MRELEEGTQPIRLSVLVNELDIEEEDGDNGQAQAMGNREATRIFFRNEFVRDGKLLRISAKEIVARAAAEPESTFAELWKGLLFWKKDTRKAVD